MITSNDVAALFASQQQGFAGRDYYANTFGPMQAGMGLGAYGAFPTGGFQPGGPQYPGLPQPPHVFNYAPGGMFGFNAGYGAGNAFANRAVAGLGGLATAGGIALGVSTMFSPMRSFAPMVDPISGFMSGFARSGLSGGMAGAAMPLALGYAAAHSIGSVVTGAQQHSMIANQLGGFNFINPASRTGMGFNRQDAADISNSIRALSHIPELMASTEELTRLLPTLRRSGVMTGVKDAAEFNRRFKETVTTIRDMSRILGSTLEEASAFFEHNRSMGFHSRTAQLQNTLNAQFTSGMTGMSMGQTMQMQAGGAAIARQFGARGQLGAAGVTNTAQRVQAAVESGLITPEMLGDISGGLSGPQAVEATSQRLYAGLMSLNKTQIGTFLLAGMAKKGANGAWELDQDLLGRLQRGEISADELRSRGQGASQSAKMAIMGPAGRNMLAQLANSGAAPDFLASLVRGKGREAQELLLDQYTGGQLGAGGVEATLALSQAGQGIDFQGFARMRATQMELRERSDPELIIGRAMKKLSDRTWGEFRSFGGRLSQGIGKAFENFVDDIFENWSVSLSKENAQSFQKALMGGSRSDVRGMTTAARGLTAGVDRSRVGKDRARLQDWLGLTGSDLDARLGAGASGALQTPAGILATDAGAVRRQQLWLTENTSYEYVGGAEGSKMLVDRFTDVMASGISKYAKNSLGMGGSPSEQLSSIKAALEQGRLDIIQRATGMSASQLGAALGETDAGYLFRAGISGGGDIKNIAARASEVTLQSKNRLRRTLDAGSETYGDVVRKGNIESVYKARRKAESDLDSVLKDGDMVAALRSNGSLRKLILAYQKDPSGIGDITAEASSSEAASALNKKFGLSLKPSDIEMFRSMRSKFGNNAAAFKAVSDIETSYLAEGGIALGEKAGLVATAIREQATGTTFQSEGESIARALDIISGGDIDAGVTALRTAGSGLVAKYGALSQKDRDKFVRTLGPVGSSVAFAHRRLSGLRSEVGADDLRRAGFSDAAIRNLDFGAEMLAGKKFSKSTVEQAIVGESLSRGLSLSEGYGGNASTTDELLRQTLSKISSNMDQQTAILAVIMEKGMGRGNMADAQGKLDAIRSNEKKGGKGLLETGGQ